MKFDNYINEQEIIEGWDEVNEAPLQTKGWSEDSLKKFGKTIGVDPKDEGFFDACVKRMEGKVGNAKGFCASIKDKAYGSPNWRGKGKSKSQVKKDVKKNRYKE